MIVRRGFDHARSRSQYHGQVEGDGIGGDTRRLLSELVFARSGVLLSASRHPKNVYLTHIPFHTWFFDCQCRA